MSTHPPLAAPPADGLMPPLPAQALAVPLADWGVIAARGEDAAAFLHGQLTQDIAGLPTGRARLAGYCSAKGRLLATFVVWRGGEHEFFLACSADLLAATMRRLSMFVLRARCKLADVSADCRLVGLAAPAGSSGLPGSAGLAPSQWPAEPGQVTSDAAGICVRLPDACGQARALWIPGPGAALPPPSPEAAARWAWLEVRSAVPRVVAATVERFVPQMVNLEVVGGVNFQKGCYPGQEVVARSQYRGTLKRRAFLYATHALARPGEDIYAADDPAQPAGTVVLAAELAGAPGSSELLAEMKIASAGGVLHLGAPDGPALKALDLPYPLPAEA